MEGKVYKIIPEDLKLIQAQILIDFQLEDNKHKEEEGKRAGEKERCSGVIVCHIPCPVWLLPTRLF